MATEVFEKIINSKILGVLSLLTAIVMIINTVLIPKPIVLAFAVVCITYFGLVGFPALMQNENSEEDK